MHLARASAFTYRRRRAFRFAARWPKIGGGSHGIFAAHRPGRRMTPDLTAPERPATDDGLDALLQRVAGGDRAAFEALYRRSSPMLLGICLRVLGDRAEAEDVLQEAFVAIWSKAAQFDPQRARATTWLGSIARHRAIDRVRALPAAALRAPIELLDEAADPAPSPARQAEAATDKARLDDCLGQLEPRRQTLIRTAFYEGATYEELAQRAGSPLGSVKSWIRRGLLQLKACLER
jgi:RNA polymerase sigma-70 factor, ECF subfamily